MEQPRYVNPNKIIEAFILEPYDGKIDADLPWSSTTNTHGWQLVLITGYSDEGYPNKITIDRKIPEECAALAEKLGLYLI